MNDLLGDDAFPVLTALTQMQTGIQPDTDGFTELQRNVFLLVSGKTEKQDDGTNVLPLGDKPAPVHAEQDCQSFTSVEHEPDSNAEHEVNPQGPEDTGTGRQEERETSGQARETSAGQEETTAGETSRETIAGSGSPCHAVTGGESIGGTSGQSLISPEFQGDKGVKVSYSAKVTETAPVVPTLSSADNREKRKAVDDAVAVGKIGVQGEGTGGQRCEDSGGFGSLQGTGCLSGNMVPGTASRAGVSPAAAQAAPSAAAILSAENREDKKAADAAGKAGCPSGNMVPGKPDYSLQGTVAAPGSTMTGLGESLSCEELQREQEIQEMAERLVLTYGLAHNNVCIEKVASDIREYGAARVEQAFGDASESDNRGGLSVRYYRTILKNQLSGGGYLQSGQTEYGKPVQQKVLYDEGIV